MTTKAPQFVIARSKATKQSRPTSEFDLIRSRLMTEIERHVTKSGLTQAQVAKLFGVTQPGISDLRRGNIHLFSVDTLIAMLSRGGMKVDVKVRKKKAA